jgi:hypothetical protein
MPTHPFSRAGDTQCTSPYHHERMEEESQRTTNSVQRTQKCRHEETIPCTTTSPISRAMKLPANTTTNIWAEAQPRKNPADSQSSCPHGCGRRKHRQKVRTRAVEPRKAGPLLERCILHLQSARAHQSRLPPETKETIPRAAKLHLCRRNC